MQVILPVPSACASREEKANWVELQALRSSSGSFSIQDFITAIRISGSIDALDEEEIDEQEEETDSEKLQPIAEDAFSELEDRFLACGGEEGAYPFDIEEQSIRLKKDGEDSIYIFLMLLSFFGGSAGPRKIKATSLFEDISAKAAEAYFGGENNHVHSKVFGFPRRNGGAFSHAVDELCRDMGEGVGHSEQINIRSKKDAGLDIVAWRNFADLKQGKLIGFGQCATGANWREKRTELMPDNFCKLWIRQPITVPPVKMFFVPHRVENIQWVETCIQAGILFDRCRIAFLVSSLIAEDVNRSCKQWSRYVIERKLGS